MAMDCRNLYGKIKRSLFNVIYWYSPSENIAVIGQNSAIGHITALGKCAVLRHLQKKDMKRTLLIAAALVLSLAACKKDNEEKPAEEMEATTPRDPAPDELIAPGNGYWSYGTVSSINYYDDASSEYRNGFGLSLFFQFTKDGGYKFLQYINSGSYTTVDQVWIETQGTITIGSKIVDGQSYKTFTLHPVKGIQRVKTASKNESRSLTKQELAAKGNLSATFIFGAYTSQGKKFLDILNADGSAPITSLHEEW